ncbi:hypothetical protein ACFL06_01065 [Patescibacteria group bacterium]
MRERLIDMCSKIIQWGVIALVFLLPLVYLPTVTDRFEFPKQLFLFFFVAVLTVVWAIKMVLERKIKILHSPFTLPVLLFFAVLFLATIFSTNQFSSLYGPYPRLHGGLVSFFIYILSFFLVASNIREKKQIYHIFTALAASGLALVVIGLLNFFNLSFFGDFLKGRFITLAGSADRTSLFLALLLPVTLLTFFFEKKARIITGILSFLFILYIFLISSLAAMVSVFLIFLLVLVFTKLRLSKEVALRIGAALLLCVLLFGITNWEDVRAKTPFLKDNPAQHDITISQNTGWAIATGGLQNLKLLALGSGPGTYLFDFTSFKPTRFNQSPFWNLRFEKSSNEYFNMVSVIGIMGLIAFLYLLVKILKIGMQLLRRVRLSSQNALEKKEENNGAKTTGIITFTTLFLFMVISLFTTSFTLTAWMFWLFLALMIVSLRSLGFEKIKEIEPSLGTIQLRGLNEKKGEIMPWIAAFIILLVLVPLTLKEIKIFNAERYYVRAQAEQIKDQPDATEILKSLILARNTSLENDAYRRALSSTSLNFAILGSQQQSITEKMQQDLLTSAITEAQTAVAINRFNIFNWENLQRVYALVTIEDQVDRLINVFSNQIPLDPTNPRHRNDLGWAYFNLVNDTELAKINFQSAITLKFDFADAHYNLARVYKEEGKTDRAVQEYEQTLTFINEQIVSIEDLISLRPDLENTYNQLIQFRTQVEADIQGVQGGGVVEPEEPEEEE